MTPKPESETDPWAKVDEDHEGKCWMDDVKVARAAEAAQHRHEIAAIAGCDGQCSCAIFTRHDAAMALFKEMDEVKALSADLAAVEAERDKAQRALATAYLKARRQASVCEPNEDQFAGAMAVVAAAFPNTRVEATAIRIAKPEEPTELVVAVKRRAERAEAERDQLQNQIIDLGARVAIADEERAEAVAIRAEREQEAIEHEVTKHKLLAAEQSHEAAGNRVIQLAAERDRLKAALQDAVYTIAGWRTGSIGSIGNVHVGSFDVEHLARLRAVLTPQGQSTDGETK